MRTKLNKARIKKICDAIRVGCTYELSAQFAGVNVRSLYLWLSKGKEDFEDGKRSLYCTLFQSVQEANATGAVTNLAVIQRAAKEGDWRASAWILANRHGYNQGIENKIQEIHIHTEQTNVKELIQQVDLNNKRILELKPEPIIDVDEE